MAKDPAFLFYPNDYIGGTMGWSFEEKGAYMEILMMQFNRGHMTEHMIRHIIGQLWDNIKDKFIKDEDGLFFNERLELEKTKRSDYTTSRRNNVLGKNQYSKIGHMSKHMEDRDVNENVIKDKGFKEPTIQEIQQYIIDKQLIVNAEVFFNFYESKGWLVGKNKMKSWKRAISGWHSRNTSTEPTNAQKSNLVSLGKFNERVEDEEIYIHENDDSIFPKLSGKEV